MKRCRNILLATLLAVAAAPSPAAQCTPEPNTGCPGALPVQCQGGTRVGSFLRLTCINNGRADLQFMVVGACSLPSAVTPPLVCATGPCNLAVALGVSASVDTGFRPVDLTIPPNPALVGASVCAQCADFVLLRACVVLSQATRILIQA